VAILKNKMYSQIYAIGMIGTPQHSFI